MYVQLKVTMQYKFLMTLKKQWSYLEYHLSELQANHITRPGMVIK